MKKQFKKGFCVLTTAAVLALSVTACGGKTAETTAAEITTAETTTQAETTTAEETTAEETTKEETTASETKAAGEALTEEEYLEAATQLSQTLTDTMTKAQSDLSALDPTDTDSAKKVIEDMKKPFTDFAAITAPEKFAATQEKYKSGCEAMIEYLDICLEMIDMSATETPSAEAAAELTNRLTESLTAVQTGFTEGSTLLAEATGATAE